MGYYNYHGQIKKLIESGNLESAEFFVKWNNLNNVIVLFFKNHAPMPIREHSFYRYEHIKIIKKIIDEI